MLCLDIFSPYKNIAVFYDGEPEQLRLLKFAVDALGKENVCAISVYSDNLKDISLEVLKENLQDLEIYHRIIYLSPLSSPQVCENLYTRCYDCSLFRYQAAVDWAVSKNKNALFDAMTFDELHLNQPKLRALLELNIKTPFLDSGLTRKDLGINCADNRCFLSQIECGTPVTKNAIRAIRAVQLELNELGLAKVTAISRYPELILLAPSDFYGQVCELHVETQKVAVKNGFSSLFLKFDLH